MEGDFFEEENGKVKHIAKRQSKKIIAGYIRFVLDDRGTEKYIVYDESDWESWRNESQQKDGKNWRGNDGQPNPGFLRTKLIKHAAMDTSWPSGSTPVGMETYNDVIDEEIAYEELPKTETKVETIAEPVKPTKQEAETIEVVDEEMNFADDKQAEEGTTITDEQIDMEFN
jgi:hypothetical protein